MGALGADFMSEANHEAFTAPIAPAHQKTRNEKTARRRFLFR
jgi:hypothetical protein